MTERSHSVRALALMSASEQSSASPCLSHPSPLVSAPCNSAAGVKTHNLVSPPTLCAPLLFYSAAAPRHGQRISDLPPNLLTKTPTSDTKRLPSALELRDPIAVFWVTPPSAATVFPHSSTLVFLLSFQSSFNTCLLQQVNFLSRDSAGEEHNNILSNFRCSGTFPASF